MIPVPFPSVRLAERFHEDRLQLPEQLAFTLIISQTGEVKSVILWGKMISDIIHLLLN